MQEFCFATVGIAFGLLFVLLFVRFDDKWKVLLESLFGIGGSGGGLVFLFKICYTSLCENYVKILCEV